MIKISLILSGRKLIFRESRNNKPINFLVLGALLSILILVSCGTGCTADYSNSDELKVPAAISIVSGNNQEGRGGETLASPIVIKVTENGGNPLEDVEVFFEVVEGEGEIPGNRNVRTDKNGRVETQWIIGVSYNTLEVALDKNKYDAPNQMIFAEGENPTGINIGRTIQSLKKESDLLYSMTLYGNYNEFLEELNQKVIDNMLDGSSTVYGHANHCSLFSAFGNLNKFLFGRNFDGVEGEQKNLTAVVRCSPPDGYSSLTIVRMREDEIGYPVGTDFSKLSFAEKERLLETLYIPSDGINEHGLTAGLASCPLKAFTPDPAKKSIFITRLIREILDHARSVNEAIALINQFDVFQHDLTSNESHVLVADASGKSAVLEMDQEFWKAIPLTGKFQVMTNTLVYGKSPDQLKQECERYRIIYDILEIREGYMDYESAFDILDQTNYYNSQWSAVYDLTDRKIKMAIYDNFNDLFEFSF